MEKTKAERKQKTTKPQLLAYLKQHAALTDEQAVGVLRALFRFSLENLEEGRGVVLPEIGQIAQATRRAGRGRDFRTGEMVEYEPKAKLVFTPAKALADALGLDKARTVKES